MCWQTRALQASVLVLLVILLVVHVRPCRDGFKARTEDIYPVVKNTFGKTGGNIPYTKFKAAVPGTDPVEYADLKAIWQKRGEDGFTMDAVDRVL